jgi:hypothetical protein
MAERPVNDDNAMYVAASRLLEAVQAIVLERLARDPQRLERVLAEAEAEAWAEVAGMLKDTMKAAIVENLLASGVTLSPSASNIFAEPQIQAPSTVETPESEAESSEPTSTDAAPIDAVSTAAAHTTISTEPLTPADIDIVPALESTSAAVSDEGVGIYVYGVIERGAAVLPEIVGIADESSVWLHEYGGLAAVVSDVPLCEFGQAAIEAQLSDLVWLEKSVRRHQAVLDQVLALAALAPMKFATIYLDATRLESWLDEQQAHLLALLTGLHGRQEWGLKLLVDRRVLAEHVALYSESVRELRAQINGKTQGAAYFLVRRIQEVTAEEVERVSFAIADAVHERLAGLSVAASINPLPGEDVEPDVQMLLNSAYLIADAEVPTIQTAVEALVVEHGENGFRFQLSGPWPAYNFVAMAPELTMADNGN